MIPGPLLAHGDLHLRIQELTRQIQGSTNNPAPLYLQRGELHREHGDRDAASADYNRAAGLDPNLPRVDLCRARLLADSGELEAAIAMFGKAIARAPEDGEAFIGRARVLIKVGHRAPAIADYQHGLDLLEKPAPEYYTECAQELVGEGKVEEALRSLDAGIQKLGPLIKLQGNAVDLELRRKNNNSAVARLNTIIATASRKESWLARRGDVLLAAGKAEEACRSFEAAIEAVHKLPPRLQQSPAMQDLLARTRSSLTNATHTAVAPKTN